MRAGYALPNRRWLVTSLAPLLAATLFGWHTDTLAAAANGKKFKDWQVRCETYKDKAQKSFDQCHIFQAWHHKSQKVLILHMAVAYPPANPSRAVAVMTMPLGIYLPAGVKIRVDDGVSRDLVFERCEPVGCKAGFPVEDDVLNEFKKGLNAYVTFSDMRRKPLTIKVSLRGFSAAIRALKP